MDILKQIQSAQKGSDIYELVDKIANCSNIKYDPKKNLDKVKYAQKLLKEFTKDSFPKGISLNLYLKDFLNTKAYLLSEKQKEKTPVDNWIESMDDLAKYISKNYGSVRLMGDEINIERFK